MGIEPGEFLASGRAADVYLQDDQTVLRRYRSAHDCEPEARLMTWLHDQGFAVPAVHEVADRDIVMERIQGPTMLEDLDRRPWMVFAHLRTLARVQKELNSLQAPGWLVGDDRIPVGSTVVHLDLHPMNVIMSPQGPVVIDWTNAGRGDADFDAALTFVLMAAYEALGLKEIGIQHLVTRLFRQFRGRRSVEAQLSAAITFRLLDENVTDGERAVLRKMLSRREVNG